MYFEYCLEEIDKAAQFLIGHAGIKTVWAFSGSLGAGKTTLISAICKQLEVVDNVSSPTFAMINEYGTCNGKTIYHIDMYRLEGEAEAVNVGIENCLLSGKICLVEWPEKAPGIMPDDTMSVFIETIGASERRITFTKNRT